MNKKVLVFGGAGFLGTHIVMKLLEEGHDVFIYDLYEPKNFIGNEKVKIILGDILDKEKVNRAVTEVNIVYNLAAMADIEECIEKPIHAISYNILGNAIILEACKKNNIERFVYASSVYSQGNSGGIYCSTKKASESIIKDYQKHHNLNYTIVQYGTLYGIGAGEKNSMHRYLKQAITKKEIEYVGDGNETREYIHVMDAAKLSVEILDKKYENKTIIITGHHPTKVSDLFNMVSEILGGVNIKYKSPATFGKKESHYKISPYSYYEDTPYKLTSNLYMDLGKGVIQILKTLDEKVVPFKEARQEIRKHCFSDEEKNIGIDFDGVIHKNSKGFYDGTIYDEPIEGAKEALETLSKDYDLIIYTAKAKPDRPLINGKTGTELIWDWLKKNDLAKYVKEVTSEKPRAICYIDDKTIEFKKWDYVLKRIEELKKTK